MSDETGGIKDIVGNARECQSMAIGTSREVSKLHEMNHPARKLIDG